MRETFRDYIIALSEDKALFEQFKKNPRETLKDARIGSEEKAALLSGDPKRITALLGGLTLPQPARNLIDTMGTTPV